MPRAAPPATADDGSSTAAAPEPSMTSVSTTTVTDPSSVNTESAGVEDAESSQGGKPTQLESGHDLTAEEEALLKPGIFLHCFCGSHRTKRRARRRERPACGADVKEVLQKVAECLWRRSPGTQAARGPAPSRKASLYPRIGGGRAPASRARS